MEPKEILPMIDLWGVKTYIEPTKIEVNDAATAITHVVNSRTYREGMQTSVLPYLSTDCTSVVMSYAIDQEEQLKVAHEFKMYVRSQYHTFSFPNLNTGERKKIIFGYLTESNMQEKDKFIEMLKSQEIFIRTVKAFAGNRAALH